MTSNTNESKEHRKVKLHLHYKINRCNIRYDFESGRFVAHTEKKIDDRKADVYFELETGERVAIEYQKSFMRDGEIEWKIQDYSKKGIYVNYVFNPENHLAKDDRCGNGIRLLSQESAEISNLFGDEIYIAHCNMDPYGRTHTWRVRIENVDIEGYSGITKKIKLFDCDGKPSEVEMEFFPVKINAKKLDKLVLSTEAVDGCHGRVRSGLITKFV